MKKRKKNYRFTILILSMILILMILFMIYYFLFSNPIRLVGTWYRNEDVSDIIYDNMENYLKDAVGGDEMDLSAYEDDYNLAIKLEFDDGEMTEILDEESYEKVLNNAKSALKRAVLDLIETRMQLAFIETDVETETIVEEALGMDIDSYLSEYGPQLLPDVSEFAEKFYVNSEYKATRNKIKLLENGIDTAVMEYAVSGGMMVVGSDEKASIYHRNLEDSNNDDEIHAENVFDEDIENNEEGPVIYVEN